MSTLTAVHIADNYLLNPTHPVTVNLIGAGGTGSQMLSALAKMNHALIELGHPGFQLTLYDDDIICEANLGRQLFAYSELGLCKSVALINRINRFFGTNWKAFPEKFESARLNRMPDRSRANLYVSCVDTAAARFDIAEAVSDIKYYQYQLNDAFYWMDFGNARYTGQVILSTVREIEQPVSNRYRTVSRLPMITDEFRDLLEADTGNNEPSCSLGEALSKQDLFINSSLASLGASLLWQLFREGMIFNRGFFLNLKDFQTRPLRIE